MAKGLTELPFQAASQEKSYNSNDALEPTVIYIFEDKEFHADFSAEKTYPVLVGELPCVGMVLEGVDDVSKELGVLLRVVRERNLHALLGAVSDRGRPVGKLPLSAVHNVADTVYV